METAYYVSGTHVPASLLSPIQAVLLFVRGELLAVDYAFMHPLSRAAVGRALALSVSIRRTK